MRAASFDMVLCEAVRAVGNGLGSACECLVIEAGIWDGPIQVLPSQHIYLGRKVGHIPPILLPHNCGPHSRLWSGRPKALGRSLGTWSQAWRPSEQSTLARS